MAPKNHIEFEDMLEFAVNEYDGPVAIRYPRGYACENMSEFRREIEYGRAEIVRRSSSINADVLFLALGSMVDVANEKNYTSTLVNLRFAKPIDTELIDKLIPEHRLVVVLEENTINGGISERIAAHMQWSANKDKECISVALPDAYIEHGKPDVLKKKYGIDKDSVLEKIINKLTGME